MAKIEPIQGSVNFAKKVWKGGISHGALTGTLQGTLGALGAHQFFARLIGGTIAASLIKDKESKHIILLESTKEAMYQLLAGE